jgi:uncharacterized membrane protein
MIKNTLLGLTAFILVSCTQVNSTGEKTITQGDDTVSSVEISTSKVDALNTLAEMDETEASKLIFKASGTEPGWFAEIYNNKLRLVVDYGKDSLILDNQKFDGLDNKEGYLLELIDDSKIKKYSFQIINKPCTDAGSGDKMDRMVVVSYKGKSYKGCGNFIK